MCWARLRATSTRCARNGVTRERSSRQFRPVARSWRSFADCASHGAKRTTTSATAWFVLERFSGASLDRAENAPAPSTSRVATAEPPEVAVVERLSSGRFAIGHRKAGKRTPQPQNARDFSSVMRRDRCSIDGDSFFWSASMQPWKCPACQTQIRHEGDIPERNRVYRCHVCHLELVVDESARTMTVAPLPTQRSRRRTDRQQS